MTVREVARHGEKVLTSKSVEIDCFDAQLAVLAKDLLDTIRHHGAIGIAAPQVFVPVRMIVIQLPDRSFETCVNPVILGESGGRIDSIEGCLSVPGRIYRIWRSAEVSLQYQDTSGSTWTRRFSGLCARIVQHEVDHLDGVLINELSSGIHDIML